METDRYQPGNHDHKPKKAAQHLLDRVRARPVPFHWFRNILKTPEWYKEVVSEVEKLDPNIQLLDAPTFFMLYKEYLKQNPEAANGAI